MYNSFRRDSIVVRKTSSHAPGVLEDVKGYGIASVYTPVSKRKNGYARHMMRLLHWVLAPHSSLPAEAFVWGAPPQPTSSTGNATFSVLYSDVGPDFYHGCGPDGVPRTGWAANGAVHTAWNVGAQASREQGTTAEWKWLSKDDVVQLYENEAEAMKQDVVASAPIGTSFSFLPNNGVGLFNINRTMVFEENSIVPILLCESWGVSLVKSNDVSPTFATWTLDARNHGTALVITRLRVQPAGLADLLAQVQEVARGINAYSVEAWNLSEDLKAEAARIGGTTEERKDHLPAYKWYGKETNDEVHWLFNEKSVALSVLLYIY
ncbi:hypothetical protein EUX98_g1628 [Antrodiella citrinella]|uniref:LYC1 C-terminal domain-containing protein n=1 Tax=Antrodiella citrinella TaxID=2447956 RepID=A0A4S4N107_9APHY|nr:hypothetical protein EUX98_g1628 [Antrodiella citrinella]